jgi:hypothetical protein
LVKWKITRKTPQKTQSSLQLNTAYCIWEEETRMQHPGIAQSSKHADTFTNGTVSPWVFLAKSSGAVKAPRHLYTLAMSQVSYKERTKTQWLPKTGLLKLDSQDFQTMPTKLFCSQTERFIRKKFQHSRKNACCNSLKC